MSGLDLACINQFFSNRCPPVRVCHSMSAECRVISGVLQGSVLGSILFIVYIIDIYYAVSCIDNDVMLKLSADDVKLYCCIYIISSVDVLQHLVNNIVRWSIIWQLNLSASKCNVLTLGPIHYNNSHSICYQLLIILLILVLL